MPRRKQGRSKETTDGEFKKKIDIVPVIIQNEASEKLLVQKEYMSKIKKVSTTKGSNNSIRNGVLECLQVTSRKKVSKINFDGLIPILNKELNNNLLTFQNEEDTEIKNKNVKTNDRDYENSKGTQRSYISEEKSLIALNNLSPKEIKEKDEVQNHKDLFDMPPRLGFRSTKAESSSIDFVSKNFYSEKNAKSFVNKTPKLIFSSIMTSCVTENVLKVPVDTSESLHLLSNEVLNDEDPMTVESSESGKCLAPVGVNGKVEKQETDWSSQMSGLSPISAVPSNPCNGSEGPQLNYRISTTITETKTSLGNDVCSSSLKISETGGILEDNQNCRLPSSVYGTSSSNIEKVLTGLHLNDPKEGMISDTIAFDKNKFLQDLYKNQTTVENKSEVLRNNSKGDDIEAPENNKTNTFLQQCKSFDEAALNLNTMHAPSYKEINPVTNPSVPNLKLHIPEISSAEDSDSSQLPFSETSRAVKFPKITSPQILEQHISKIISENAAIVETLDPLWSRRYLRQTSSTSGQSIDTETKKSSNLLKLRRASEDRSSVSNTTDSSNHSKLQSALLGTFEADPLGASQNSTGTSHVPSASTPFSLFNSLPTSASSSSIFSKSSSTVTEEELKGSAIKSLLSLKQGKYSKQKNSFCFDKQKYDQHPQNPEGSIIKDLLLKSKSKGKQVFQSQADEDVANKGILNPLNFSTIMNSKMEEMQPLVQQCSGCSMRFVDKNKYHTHLALCKLAKEHGFDTINVNDTKTEFLSDIYLQSKNSNFDKTINTSLPILNPSILSSSIQSLLKNETDTSRNADDGIGRILKKQLLSPMTNRKSPPVKRRKISEPVISASKLSELQQRKVDELASLSKSISSSRPFERTTLSPHRCRSQSVHLFGGEVQILDGTKTKKLKIMTSLQGAFSSTTNAFCENHPFKKIAPFDLETAKDDAISLPKVVVTIAQPVHNSGGTVTHVPAWTESTPIVTLSNHLISPRVENLSELVISSTSSLLLPFCGSPNFPMSVQSMTSDVSETVLSPLKSFSINSSYEKLSPSSIYLPNANPSPLSFLPSFPQSNFSQSSSSPGSRDILTSYATEILPVPLKSTFGLSCEEDDPKKHIAKQTHLNLPVFNQDISRTISESQSMQNRVIPTVMFTPSSPTLPPATDKDRESVEDNRSENSKKFLAPMRPTSLPLKKKPFTMVGSTLISPETPRPKKSCVQMYLNGHAYTYLGLKCSTRSTYCCIYRPQPMFVLQETNPKLSMYSNWQVVPSKEELSGLTPGQMIALYNSKQSPKNSESVYTTAKLGEPLLFTHSSYWAFRSQEKEKKDSQDSINDLLPLNQGKECAKEIEQQNDITTDISQNVSMECSVMSDGFPHKDIDASSLITNDDEGNASSVTESTFQLDAETSDADEDNTHDDDDDDDDDDNQDDGTESFTDSSQPQPPKRVKIFEGGFKSNEDYTYVRGRGRGKYVCEECGIRCKKPSMLKKHIRTHTDLRPYKCRHCSFAFKTKGNLTKHMKSKAHHKKCTELGIVPVPTTTDDSQIDEEALAKQESFEKKNPLFSDGEDADDDDDDFDEEYDDSDGLDEEYESDSGLMAANQKNSVLANGHSKQYNSLENVHNEPFDDSGGGGKHDTPSQQTVEQEAARSLLHLSALTEEPNQWPSSAGEMSNVSSSSEMDTLPLCSSNLNEAFVAISPHHSMPATTNAISPVSSKVGSDQTAMLYLSAEPLGHRPRSYSADVPLGGGREQLSKLQHVNRGLLKMPGGSTMKETSELTSREPYTRRYSISVAREARKPRVLQAPLWSSASGSSLGLQKWTEMDASDQPMDLRVSKSTDPGKTKSDYGSRLSEVFMTALPPDETVPLLSTDNYMSESYQGKSLPVLSAQTLTEYDSAGDSSNNDLGAITTLVEQQPYGGNVALPQPPMFYVPEGVVGETLMGRKEADLVEDQTSPEPPDYAVCSPVSPPPLDENSSYYYAHESVGQVMNSPDGMPPTSRFHAEFIMPSPSSMEEGKCVCRICNKIFAKSSQLRLHVNIHYFERPFRCDNCAVSFRTKGHLQKHKRSVSHYNKVNMNMTFGTPTIDNPRPFKCGDCKIAFRIHGHLAKHLRSKMHIMKLECLGKLPFGMYAEMERSGISLNEIDTTDCNNSLESLQVMAQKLYQRDPRRMRWHSPDHIAAAESASVPLPPITETAITIPVAFSPPCAIGVPSIVNLNPNVNTESDVKQEPSDLEPFRNAPVFSDGEMPVSSPSHYSTTVTVAAPGSEMTQRLDAVEVDSGVLLHRSGTCHICGRMFKSAKSLQVHLYCDHPPSGEIQQTFSSSSSHTAVATQDLVCDLCRRHFQNQNSLQQHLLSHAQPRPFVCEVCDAGFTSSASLIAHLATHQQMSSSISGVSETGLVQLR